MKRYIASFLDIRKGEFLLTFLMLAYYYLVLVTYYLLKPARDSLFLVELGANQLPIVFILIALIIAPITTVYSRASRSLRLTQLIYVTSVILIANLAVLRWLLTLDASWVYYVFYVWVSIYGALAASQYWLFANAVYDPAQGKRLFALLNLGGILGAMTGGEVTNLLVKHLGVATEDLLLVCIGLVAGFVFLVQVVWRMVLKERGEGKQRQRTSSSEKKKESIGEMFTMITRSRHLAYLVGIIAMTMATASFVDYQFKAVSIQSFPAKADLTSFLGVFYGRLSLVSLVLQVVFTYRFLRLLGVGGVVMFLPLGLLLGSATMLLVPGLLAAVLLRGADGAFKYSMDKTGRELLFLPIPLEVKKRTKVFIDMFVDRWFRGIAGGALLLFTTVLGFGVRQLSFVVIVLLLVWLFLVTRIRKEYVNTFRIALAKREIDASQLTVSISDASTVNTLRESLKSDNEREVCYALELLASTSDKSLVSDLEPLLQHPSADVRTKTLHALRGIGDKSMIERIEPMTADTDARVRMAALQFVGEHAGDDADLVIKKRISGDDARAASSAVRFVAEFGTTAQRAMVEKDTFTALLRRCGSDSATDEEARVEIARALGSAAGAGSGDLLVALLDDPSRRVVGEAIISMGRTRNRRFVTPLLDKLSDHSQRKRAREALAAYGDGVVGTLSDILGDETVDIGVRRYVPLVLRRITTQRSVDELTSNLTGADASLKLRVLKALNSLRNGYPDLKVREDRIDAAFVEETRIYYEILQISVLHEGHNGSEGDALLERALHERLDLNLERIFRLLGLHYPPTDIYTAYLGIVGTRKDQRASAIEFLDNVVGKGMKKYLFPIIDQTSEKVAVKRGQELFGVEIKTREQGLLRLIEGSDAWLRACAIFCVRETESDELARAVEKASRDADPVVAETAALVLSRRK